MPLLGQAQVADVYKESAATAITAGDRHRRNGKAKRPGSAAANFGMGAPPADVRQYPIGRTEGDGPATGTSRVRSRTKSVRDEIGVMRGQWCFGGGQGVSSRPGASLST